MPSLIAEHVGHRFGRRVLFRDVAFSLDGGQALAVTGANGSGKSTLLSIIAGLRRPVQGRVQLQESGKVVPDEDRPLHAGLVAPYLNVYDGFSARENLAFIARARRLPRAEERIAAMLELVGLADRADDLVAAYSSGMKQRVKFAAALLPEPPLILLDEPTTNLDEAGRAMVDQVVAHQRNRGGLLVLATNNRAEAAWCDRELCVEDYR